MQQSIEEANNEDDWELEDAEEVPIKSKQNMSQEEAKVTPEPKEVLNFHQRGQSKEESYHTIKADESVEQDAYQNNSALSMGTALLGTKKDMHKTFNVENPGLIGKKNFIAEEQSNAPRAGTNLSQGPKDESSGAQPKSSNQSEDQSAMLVQGNKPLDKESDSTIKPAAAEQAPKLPIINKEMITKAYQAEVQRQMEENKRKLALFAKKGGKGADDLLKKIQEMKKQ